MDFITAITQLDFSQVVVGAGAVLAFFGVLGSQPTAEAEDDSYETASWNPASVNYND